MRTKNQANIDVGELFGLAKPASDWKQNIPQLGLAFCLVVYFGAIVSQALLSFSSALPLYDYGSLYASVYAWAHNLNPYLVYPLTSHSVLGVRGIFSATVNLNPPSSLYLFRPIVALGPLASIQVWTLVSVCLFCASMFLVIRANPSPALRTRILLSLGMAGVWYTFELGQIYMLLLLLTAVAWSFFKKNRFLAAGIAIGLLCALKPNFLVWPVLLILARYRKAGVSAILTFGAASVAPLLSGNGIQLYRQWVTACRSFRGVDLATNSSIVAMLMRLDPYTGTSHYFRDIGFALTSVFLLSLAWFVMRKTPGLYRTSEIALVASLLAGPITWAGYTIVLIPMLYEKPLNSLTRIGWVILCIPALVIPWTAFDSPLQFALLGAPYFYGLVLIGAALFYDLYREPVNRKALSETELAVSAFCA